MANQYVAGPSLEERFWEKVEKTDYCWNWTNAQINGHGVIWDEGVNVGAHRVSYIIHFGKIPDWLWVLHKCDNGLCVNPDHLYVGTPKMNSADRIIRGRANVPKGEQHYKAKITIEIAREIKQLAKLGKTPSEMSRLFDLSRQSVGDIVYGRTWKGA